MQTLKKNVLQASVLLAAVLLTTGCPATLKPSPPVVVEPPKIPPLSPTLAKEPPPSGHYLNRAEERRQRTLESLKVLPPR